MKAIPRIRVHIGRKLCSNVHWNLLTGICVYLAIRFYKYYSVKSNSVWNKLLIRCWPWRQTFYQLRTESPLHVTQCSTKIQNTIKFGLCCYSQHYSIFNSIQVHIKLNIQPVNSSSGGISICNSSCSSGISSFWSLYYEIQRTYIDTTRNIL